MTTRATARETTRATVGREESHGRAPRSARPVTAGYRTFRRRCRLSTRQKTSCIFAESAATYFLPLTKWFRLLFSAGQILPPLHMPAEITARSKVDISRVARLFRAQFCHRSGRHVVSSSSAEGASDFCQTMPPSGRQLMSIGASEHWTFVRAKARFAGQRLRNTVLSVEMLLHRTYCHVLLVAFSGGKCRACLALPDVPASDLPVLIHSRWNASCPALRGIRRFQV